MDATTGSPGFVEVLIVGAGVSGIGAAYYLQRDHPGRSYLILEARGASGGTWDLFRYPGVRSDSDLHTFGYKFRPWRSDQTIADAGSILAYLRATAAEYGIDRQVRYHRQVRSASWSSADACWTVEVAHADTGEQSVIRCRWLLCAAGYYRYDQGFTPEFAGRERFAGPVVHPQHWPPDLDYGGQRVVVIGSGATAATLVPAMAATAGHVTMVQRTPSYVLSLPGRSALNARLTRWVGADRAFAVTRRINIARQVALWRFCRAYPRAARRIIRSLNARMLPPGYPVDEHFKPPYQPWDQRMCLVPDGDMFEAISAGKASVVTGRIEAFTEHGLLLADGREVPADIIVTATGLNVQPMGGMTLSVDDQPVQVPSTYIYKGIMLSGVPNFIFVFGYTNASWTLKVGLLGEHFTELLRYMDARGYGVVTPVADPQMAALPFTALSAGYLRRALDQLPRQGDRGPWRMPPTVSADARLLRRPSVAGPDLRFDQIRETISS